MLRPTAYTRTHMIPPPKTINKKRKKKEKCNFSNINTIQLLCSVQIFSSIFPYGDTDSLHYSNPKKTKQAGLVKVQLLY